MAMRVVSQKITKGLDGNNGSGNRTLLGDNGLEKHFQYIPGTPAEFGEQFSVIEKVSSAYFWYAEDEMAVGNGFEDFLAEPFTKFQAVTGAPAFGRCPRNFHFLTG